MDTRRSKREQRQHKRQHKRRVILLVVVLFLGGLGLIFNWDQIKKDLATFATAPEPTELEEPESFPVAIRVVGASSWLTVTVDGQTILDQLAEPGFSEEFEVNREITITTDKPESVWVVEEGEELGPISAIVGEDGPSYLTISTEETTDSLQEAPTGSEESSSASREEENGVRVIVSVVSADAIGLSILEDGQLVYDQVTSSGFSEEFQAEEAITITAPDGGAVQVGVGGENPEPLGASGEWTTRTFTAESQGSSD